MSARSLETQEQELAQAKGQGMRLVFAVSVSALCMLVCTIPRARLYGVESSEDISNNSSRDAGKDGV